MMTYEEAKHVLGPVDDTVIADVLRTEASREELIEALAWIGSDDALMKEGRARPSGTVAALVEILAPPDDDTELAGAPASPPFDSALD